MIAKWSASKGHGVHFTPAAIASEFTPNEPTLDNVRTMPLPMEHVSIETAQSVMTRQRIRNAGQHITHDLAREHTRAIPRKERRAAAKLLLEKDWRERNVEAIEKLKRGEQIASA